MVKYFLHGIFQRKKLEIILHCVGSRRGSCKLLIELSTIYTLEFFAIPHVDFEEDRQFQPHSSSCSTSSSLAQDQVAEAAIASCASEQSGPICFSGRRKRTIHTWPVSFSSSLTLSLFFSFLFCHLFGTPYLN